MSAGDDPELVFTGKQHLHMGQTLHHEFGRVEIEPLDDGRRRVHVHMADAGAFVTGPTWITSYSPELIGAILRVKGPAWLCDELQRDEDPHYVENDFRHDVLGFIEPGDFLGKRVLDFGCGCGASTAVVSRLLPGANITGIELDAPSLEIARMRADHYGLNAVEFLLSPDADSLPPDLGEFDFILFSAVFEHLLPEERTRLLPKIWAHLSPDGVLFLNQTPHRYFPIEGHTTGLPLINYLPDGATHWLTEKFCGRIPQDTDWTRLLRMGIRGGTPGEILGILTETGEKPLSLVPGNNGLTDHLDLWEKSSRVRHAGTGHKVKATALKMVRAITGHTVVPNISLAIRKV